MQLVVQSIPVRKEVKSLREIQRTFGPVEKAAIKMSFLPHQSSKGPTSIANAMNIPYLLYDQTGDQPCLSTW